jgi:hypothetical protein
MSLLLSCKIHTERVSLQHAVYVRLTCELIMPMLGGSAWWLIIIGQQHQQHQHQQHQYQQQQQQQQQHQHQHQQCRGWRARTFSSCSCALIFNTSRGLTASRVTNPAVAPATIECQAGPAAGFTVAVLPAAKSIVEVVAALFEGTGNPSRRNV